MDCCVRVSLSHVTNAWVRLLLKVRASAPALFHACEMRMQSNHSMHHCSNRPSTFSTITLGIALFEYPHQHSETPAAEHLTATPATVLRAFTTRTRPREEEQSRQASLV